MTPRSRWVVLSAGSVVILVSLAVALLITMPRLGPPGYGESARWESADGRAYLEIDFNRAQFEGLVYIRRSFSCDKTFATLSGTGRVRASGYSLSILLDEPLALDANGALSMQNIILVALGPSWDPWRSIAMTGCDTDGSDAAIVLSRVE